MLFPAFIVHMAVVVIGFGATLSGQPADDQISGISGTVYRLSGNHMPAPNRRPRSAADTGRTSGSRTSGADSSNATPNYSGAPSSGNVAVRTGVKAIVCIFPLTSDSQVVRTSDTGSPYYKAVLTHLIRQVDTDDKGYFQVALPPGTYSVFTKNGDLFYATQRDEKNNIAPVKVLPGKITRIQCSVESDHKVVY